LRAESRKGSPVPGMYRAALYMRLSKDDEGTTESTSITTQRKMLRNYAQENGYAVTDEYIDGADIIGLNQKTLIYRGCDKEGFEKSGKINGLRQQQTGNVC